MQVIRESDDAPQHQYPMAVYAPFVNHRIKAQRGTFVMFGLDNLGEKIKDNGRDYKNDTLKEMQKTYKKMCDESNGEITYMRFLTEVEISKESKQKIANSLKDLGIGKSNIYPELENISKELTKEVKAYFEIKKK